jgi:hypothetical protein
LRVNQIYIDEVQDLTMAQILPLISMCSDPYYGMMFAGDTAQVIARGSVFRFQDLKSLIYNSVIQRTTISKPMQPTVFNLTRNCKLRVKPTLYQFEMSNAKHILFRPVSRRHFESGGLST